MSGTIQNTGHSVIFRSEVFDPETAVNITDGPLSYRYRFEEIHLHYGRTDDRGSEHTLAGYAFPAEVGEISFRYTLKWENKLHYTGVLFISFQNILSVKVFVDDNQFCATFIVHVNKNNSNYHFVCDRGSPN